MFRAQFDLVNLTFDLLTLAVYDELRAWYIKHTYQLLESNNYPFLSNVWLNLITLPSLRSLRMRRVTWFITGGEMIHIFEIPDPKLPIHFVSSKELRRRLSYVIGEK